MTTQTHGLSSNLTINCTVIVGLVILMAVLLVIGYAWMETNQVIAPPGMRIMDGLWRLFFFWK